MDPWSIQFRFADRGRISLESKFEHQDAKGAVHLHDCQDRTPVAVYLRELLQQTISGVQAEPFCLTLRFDNGAILRIHSDAGPYECGQIHDAGDRIIVF